jgi:phosphoribosylformylglycinamidine synthase
MAMASGIGAQLDAGPLQIPAHAYWFGEDQACYVVTLSEAVVADVLRRASTSGVPARRLGATGGAALEFRGQRALKVAHLRRRFESWFPAYMAGAA